MKTLDTLHSHQHTEAFARPLRILRSALDDIRQTVGSLPPETGGMLGGSREIGVVTHFHFDRDASRTRSTYSPDHEKLNQILAKEWNPRGIQLMGFVHSHPHGARFPSAGDEVYASRILAAVPDLDRLLLPIAMVKTGDTHFELLPFGVVRDGDQLVVEKLNIVVEDDAKPMFRELPIFARVQSAYDLDRLQQTRVVAIGCGGAAEFVEALARAGVGEFVLCDPDIVSHSNVATQQVYRRDIGRAKVDCLAERLRDINPHALVVHLKTSLDELEDVEVRQLLFEEVIGRPRLTLLCGMTDAFDAQARVNRLALQFAVPSLCAQVYAEGLGAEVTFTHPETTPACHRCSLNGRYRAFLEEGYRNVTTSDGTPVGSTSRLNALKFFVAMALLHHSTGHPRWGDILTRIGNRNLIQLRLHPDLVLPAFKQAFGGADPERIFCDETVWLPQLPDNPSNGYPTCPDCGGSGDLRNATGTFSDTRKMRR
jgi:molybdopterin/thiamine biosynthesis adenylyltransferase/proteasome lid subunit RPN8/RPN11